MARRENGTGAFDPRYGVRFWINGRHIREHTLRAEKALGHALPKDAEVHHWYGNPPTLVICPNEAYHQLLHMRERQARAAALKGKSVWEILGG